MLGRILALTALAAAVLAAPRPAAACSCAPPPPPAESLAAADAVLLGEVAKVEQTADAGSAGRLDVVVEVERWFKGEGGARAEMITAASTAACGFPFEEGRRYLIYATETEDGALQVSLCSRSRPAEQATEDLEELSGAPEPETEPEPAGAAHDDSRGADSPGDLGGRSSKKGRGCAVGPAGDAGLGALALVALAASRYARRSKSRATELMQ